MLLAACDPYFLPRALLAMLFQATVLGSPVATKERQVGEASRKSRRLERKLTKKAPHFLHID